MKRTLGLAVAFVLVSALVVAAQSAPAPQAPRTSPAFVDANGDGICDNYQGGTRTGAGQGSRRGQRMGPRDGSGYGGGAGVNSGTGTGICDGTGPKGNRGRRGGRG